MAYARDTVQEIEVTEDSASVKIATDPANPTSILIYQVTPER